MNKWSFADRSANSIAGSFQRGLKVYREVCQGLSRPEAGGIPHTG